MSPGEEDDEVYSDAPSNALVSDLRLRIAMFDRPTAGTSAVTKPKLAPQPSRPTNGVGPKAPVKLPPKTKGHGKAPTPMAPSNGKPASKPGPLLPKHRSNEETSEGKVGAPSAIRQSIFHQGERGKNVPATKSNQSSATLESHWQNDTLYPPDKTKANCETPLKPPKLNGIRAPDMDLIKVDGRTFRKLPFVVPVGPARAKPAKLSPALYARVGNKNVVEKEEIYEEATSYTDKPYKETKNAGESDEDEYEVVDAFSKTFRKQETNGDDELYDDVNVTA